MGSHTYISNKKNDDIFININGELFHRSEAKISVFDSGFLLGDGIWEGIRLHQSKLVFIEDHLDRLYASAQGISLDIPYSKKEIIYEINKVLDKNKMDDNIHIRLVISRGDKITPYQNPNANVGPINLVIIPEYKETDPDTYIKGINIGRVPNIRPNESILSPHYNTLSKLNCILASIEANKLGYDEYCLNGITRGKAIAVCNENKIECSEINFTFKDIKTCNEAFVTGTFAGIIPVSQLEGKRLESTNADSLVNKIRMLYNQEIQNYID